MFNQIVPSKLLAYHAMLAKRPLEDASNALAIPKRSRRMEDSEFEKPRGGLPSWLTSFFRPNMRSLPKDVSLDDPLPPLEHSRSSPARPNGRIAHTVPYPSPEPSDAGASLTEMTEIARLRTPAPPMPPNVRVKSSTTMDPPQWRPPSSPHLLFIPPSLSAYGTRQPMFIRQHQQALREKDSKLLAALRADETAYAEHCKRGYTQDFSTFRDLVKYKQHVDKLNQTADQSSTTALQSHRLRDADTIQRVLKNAKASMASPRPPRISSLKLEELTLRDARLDKALDLKAVPRRKWPATLAPDLQLRVNELMRKQGVISTLPGAEVADRDMRKLKPGQWLNDEVINFYCVMINRRSAEYQAEYAKLPKEATGKVPKRKFSKVHAFSSFFYSKLKATGYEGVRRWTKKIDVFSLDNIIIPINLHNAHWVCACINIRRKRFEFYDSMNSFNVAILEVLRDYLVAEHQDKKNKPLDLSGWEDYKPEDIPQQENCSDCGVFTSMVAECLSRPDAALDYEQENMMYLRSKMCLEIAEQHFIDEAYL